MRRREMGSLSVDENVADVTNNDIMSTNSDIMSTNKLYFGDRVKISTGSKVDQDGKDITDVERNIEFIVTQTYENDKNMYFISKEDFKHKLSAKELVKVVE